MAPGKRFNHSLASERPCWLFFIVRYVGKAIKVDYFLYFGYSKSCSSCHVQQAFIVKSPMSCSICSCSFPCDDQCFHCHHTIHLVVYVGSFQLLMIKFPEELAVFWYFIRSCIQESFDLDHSSLHVFSYQAPCLLVMEREVSIHLL